jgi:hypothetical protein
VSDEPTEEEAPEEEQDEEAPEEPDPAPLVTEPDVEPEEDGTVTVVQGQDPSTFRSP